MSNYLPVGSVLNGKRKYTIESALHSGGFGNTYLVKGTYMDGNIPQEAVYTIKEFFVAKYCRRADDGRVETALSANAARFEAAKADFYTEANILHGLSHAGIVPVNEVFEQNNTVYYVMKHLGNTSLAQYVTEHGGMLAETEALRIIRLVAGALAYLHNRQIMHLDIKPDNIMMCPASDGTMQPVLIDFGQAMFYSNGKSKTAHCVSGYTQGYSAIELKQPGAANTFMPSLDVYSLCATLFYMLTGKNPDDASQVTKRSVYLAMPSAVSERTMDTIVAGMAQNAQQRTPSVDAFLALLSGQSVAGQAGHVTQPVTDPIDDKNPAGHTLSMRIVGVAVVAAVAIGAVVMAVRGLGEGGQGSSSADTTAVKNDTAKTDSTHIYKVDAGAKTGGIEAEATKDDASDVPEHGQNPTAPARPSSETTSSGSAAESMPTNGTVNLGYATWTGGLRGGRPHGKGTMRFGSSHSIQGCSTTAQPGDYVVGYCENGELQNGVLYHEGEKVETFVR